MPLTCGAEVTAEAAVRAVGHDDEAGSNHVMSEGSGVGVGIDGDRCAADESTLDDRCRRLVSHQHRGAGLDSTGPQVCVEHVAAQCGRVVGQVAMSWPRCGDVVTPMGESNSGESMSAERGRIDVEEAQFAERSWRECITAGLVASNRTLLDDGDMMTGVGQPGGDGRSGRATTDDEDVGVQGVLELSAVSRPPGASRARLRGRSA